MTLTPHQIKALRYIADNSYGGKYSVNVERGEVGTRTAHALEKLGLVTLEAEAGSYVSQIGGFTGYAGGQRAGYQTTHFTEVRARLTPEGQALAASLPAPTSQPKLPRWAALWAAAKKNPSPNDPGLTVAGLKLRRVGPGHYEHVNRATGTVWSIFHRTGEYRGENEWVYMRTDENAWAFSESRAQDAYATKADAAEALVDRLRHRITR